MVSRYRVRGIIAITGVVLIALVAGVLRFHLFHPTPKVAALPMRILPVASYPRILQRFDSRLSPDGNRVAFTRWDEREDCCNSNIYVKQIGGEKTLRLTTDPAFDYSPVWSPDGRYIAFCRRGEGKGKGAIYIVPAVGGPERKLLTFSGSGGYFEVTSLDWSPDGKYLVYGDHTSGQFDSLFLVNLDNPNDKRPLTTPPHQTEDGDPRFSPDGQSVAFVRTYGRGDVFLVPTSGGEPRRLTFEDAMINGLDWTPDGAYVTFSSESDYPNDRGVGLWKVLASGGRPEPLSLSAGVDYDHSLSRDGRRLVYTAYEHNTNIWQYERREPTGQSPPPKKLIASEGENISPQFSPDGKRVAFVSTRSGNGEIWISNSDGSNPRQLTFVGRGGACCPRWSPDGREIAFQTPFTNPGGNIYVVGAEGGQPRSLDTTGRPGVAGASPRSWVAAPSWSRDGRWIYFGSTSSGAWQVWKVPAQGGHAVQVTRKGGVGGLESPDGKTFYYAKGHLVQGLWKVPVQGGEETQVNPQFWAEQFERWGLAREGIYFYDDDTSAVEFFSFATHQVTQILKPEKKGEDVALSPDGRWILFSQVDVDVGRIMLIENFRW
jgi:Tol biopolymer transport system component